MLRKSVPFILLACLAVAGCWQSRARPYRDAIGVQPFAAGTVTATDSNGKVTQYTLHKVARRRYLMALSIRGRNFGQGYELGLFPLPGAPGNVLVLQLATLNFHTGDESLRYYGLLTVTGKGSAAETLPDCDKDAVRAHIPAAYIDKGGSCIFPDRASLEKSLLALWQSGKKPDTSLRLVTATGSPR